YGVAGMADFFVLNLVEFWTGSNPMACNGLEEKDIYVDGNHYRMEASECGVKLEQLSGDTAGQILEVKYDADDSTVKMTTNNGTKVIGYYQADGLNLINPDGTIKVIRM
ncbi:MAG: DUF3332 family protein, partial [Candidatus Cloacimonetes bacterium]|nr:DUF3332 family protein [Candidatus Cloacimonadota bacterium]